MEFDDIADSYVSQRARIPRDLVQWLLKAIEKLHSRTVAEVGCGPAYILQDFSNHAAKLIAIDVSYEMLALVSHRLKTALTIQARGEALPLKDQSADLIVFCRSIHLMDHHLALREAVRISSKAALISVITEAPNEGKYTAAEFCPEISDLRAVSRRAYPTKPQLQEAAEQAGLTLASFRSFEVTSTYTITDYVNYHLLRPFSYSFGVSPTIWENLVSKLNFALRENLDTDGVTDRFIYNSYILTSRTSN